MGSSGFPKNTVSTEGWFSTHEINQHGNAKHKGAWQRQGRVQKTWSVTLMGKYTRMTAGPLAAKGKDKLAGREGSTQSTYRREVGIHGHR